MLELRPACENCGRKLPNESDEAMICTFECTFCTACVHDILQNVCPNCGGGFEKRPVRPQGMLQKYPAKTEEYLKPVDMKNFLLFFPATATFLLLKEINIFSGKIILQF